MCWSDFTRCPKKAMANGWTSWTIHKESAAAAWHDNLSTGAFASPTDEMRTLFVQPHPR